MSDPVEKFIEEFEAAIEGSLRGSERRRHIGLALRQTHQLADSLDRLAGSGLITVLVTADDLRALHQELERGHNGTELGPLIVKAKALITVVENGIVDGDLDRLRSALDRAGELTPRSVGRSGPSRRRLTSPVRVTCTTCDDIVVGRRGEGALSWTHLLKELRDHESEQHDEFTERLREELRRVRERLDAGDALLEAGRYELRQS